MFATPSYEFPFFLFIQARAVPPCSHQVAEVFRFVEGIFVALHYDTRGMPLFFHLNFFHDLACSAIVIVNSELVSFLLFSCSWITISLLFLLDHCSLRESGDTASFAYALR